MATTPAGRRLTERHMAAQIRIARQAQRHLRDVWPLLQSDNLDGSRAAYLRAAVAVLRPYKQQSADAAAEYLRAFRAAEGVPGDAPVRLAADVIAEQWVTSLTVTGPVAIKRATRRGETPRRADALGLALTLKGAQRLVLEGARDTLVNTIRADRRALGVARATDGDPCHFCAMLAGRGAVYTSAETATFNPHDGCGCQPEPAYSHDYEAPGKQYEDLWQSATKGLHGKEAERAFRRAFNASRAS